MKNSKKEKFYSLLKENEFVFWDGAMGTMIQAKGLEAGGIPEMLNFDKPDWIYDIHSAYVNAGAQIVCANTFGCNRLKMAGTGKTVEEIIGAAVKIAKKACGEKALVALDMGPIGQLLEPTGGLSFEEAYDIFKEQVIAAAGAGADLIACETMTDLYELKAAVLAVKENSDLPLITTMTFEENMRTFTGCSVASMALTMEGLGVDAMGVNCSLGPVELEPVVAEFSRNTSLPITVKPNAGLPDPVTGEYNISPGEFAKSMARLAKYGMKIAGGCCGTTPDFIRAAADALGKLKYTPQNPELHSAVCSPAKAVVIDSPKIIGERINPTGKKRFKEALRSGDTDYILSQALEQAKAGADLLDVNVGLPGIDEKAVMVKTVKAVQGITDLPLQLDSTIPEVLEAALRAYNGKPIVNSVNGEEKSLETILPPVKKYGAAVVGLTLDEGGIPKTAEGRFKIAEKIMNRAMEMGIPKRDIFIDCLTLTASAEQEGVMETVKAVAMVKKELGLKTVLGVSNISFGLPNRELINANFLQMCLANGLDLPIINPNVPAMTGAVRAYKVLCNIDKNAEEFIRVYNAAQQGTVALTAGNGAAAQNSEKISPEGLIAAVCGGIKGESGSITKELLKERECMEIVDKMLIPALDKAGADFESGRIFLPQLILAAGAAQAAFEEIKKSMGGSKGVSKGKVVLATVKGDIHDIGKNIVKVLLENYGFEVIDLGRDVPCGNVLNAAMAEDVKLVGLSALMTTTLGSMEDTIALVKQHRPDCRIVVGGAVLTPEYAVKIGADYYAKDAKATVDAAREVYGC